ncbi:MAG: glycosyltransferase [Verrucomicrobia bacterium]|nr:MAG: glycosyltransferase [Verrucomicrobiota bacterium]
MFEGAVLFRGYLSFSFNIEFMKIWLVTSEYPEGGGIARYVANIADALAKRKIDLTIITRAKSDEHRRLRNGVKIVGFKPNYENLAFENSGSILQSKAFPYNVLSYWPALSYQIADLVENLIGRLGPPDLIECQEYGALSYYLLQKKLIGHRAYSGIPILLHCHSPSFILAEANHEPAASFPNYWVGEMEKFCISAADALLAPSHFLAKQISEKVLCGKEIDVIPLPISQSDFTPSPKTTSSQPTVLYFGRLEVRKGVLKALESMERLWKANEGFRAVFVGGDTEYMPQGTTVGTFIRAKYGHRIQSNQLQLHDNCAQQELKKHIVSAEVVIVPSLWENFPNTCIEAMLLESVVLASKQGGQAELIGSDGKNGILFDWEVAGDFTCKLSRLLKISPSERKEIGKRARLRVRDYCSEEQVVSRRLEHFERVIRQQEKPKVFPAPWLNYQLPSCLSDQVPSDQKQEEVQFSTERKPSGSLSVVIPFFNLGKYVRDAVESTLRSTRTPEEVLIVDDCSTGEDDQAILLELQNEYPAVRVVRHPTNKGLAETRNTGAKEAKGEFIAFLDADDEVEPQFFEKALPVLESYTNVGFVYSWVQYFENSQDIWPTWNAHFPYLLGHNMLTPICVVRRRAFLEVGGNNPKFEYSLEDYESWINLLKHGWLGVSLPECLVRYRVRAGSMYRSATDDQFRYLYDLLARTHPELYRQWGHELAQLQAANGSGIRWNHPAMNYSSPLQSEPQLQYTKLDRAVRRLHRTTFVRLLLKQRFVRRALEKTLDVITKI